MKLTTDKFIKAFDATTVVIDDEEVIANPPSEKDSPKGDWRV